MWLKALVDGGIGVSSAKILIQDAWTAGRLYPGLEMVKQLAQTLPDLP